MKPLLERTSGKCCGPDFGLCYSPEFIALGTVIRDFLNPDPLLIGESDTGAGDWLTAFHRNSLRITAPVAQMSPINAELAKPALNTYVTAKITLANVHLTCHRMKCPIGRSGLVIPTARRASGSRASLSNSLNRSLWSK